MRHKAWIFPKTNLVWPAALQPFFARTKGDGFKTKEQRLRLDTRKKFFTVKVVRHWHRLSREAGDAPSLAVFKARLDEALSSMISKRCFSPWQGMQWDDGLLSFFPAYTTPWFCNKHSHRIPGSLRLEKTTKITKSNPNPSHHAHWPHPSVPHLHGSWTPPGTVTPPPSWAACATASRASG